MRPLILTRIAPLGNQSRIGPGGGFLAASGKHPARLVPGWIDLGQNLRHNEIALAFSGSYAHLGRQPATIGRDDKGLGRKERPEPFRLEPLV
jgi:hypothetical protein